MRNYENIDRYLNELASDIYAQPEDKEHTRLAYKVIDLWMSRLPDCKSVIDVGCGTGFCEDMFKVWNVAYEGVCLGEDYLTAREKGHNVKRMDFSFLEYADESFDLVFSRHSWEHSPIPILTLKEWHRVSKQWLGLVLPTPDFYTVRCRNHYNVLYKEQILWLLEASGWKIIWDEIDYLPRKSNQTEENPEGLTPHEYWLFCEKSKK